MICKYCGGEFDNKLLQCPYCDSENIAVAEREQAQKIDEYVKKTREIEKLPEIVGRKAAKFTFKGMIIGAIIIVAVLGLLALGVMVVRNIKSTHQKNIINQLESMYQSGDYTAMAEYLDKMDYDSMHRKYYNVARLTNQYNRYQKNNIDDIEDAIQSGDSTKLQKGLRSLFEIVSGALEIDAEGYPHDEEVGIIYYSDLAYTLLKQNYLLTESEIDNALKGETSIEDLAIISLERLCSK